MQLWGMNREPKTLRTVSGQVVQILKFQVMVD
jgi:hypothetical protein